jgi:hypothetical protein
MMMSFAMQKPFSFMMSHLLIVDLSARVNSVLFRTSLCVCVCVCVCVPMRRLFPTLEIKYQISESNITIYNSSEIAVMK